MFFSPCQNPAPSYSAQQDAKPWCCQASFQLPKEKELIKRAKEAWRQAQSPWIQYPPAGPLASEQLLLCPAQGASCKLCCSWSALPESCRIDPSQGTPQPVLVSPLFFKNSFPQCQLPISTLLLSHTQEKSLTLCLSCLSARQREAHLKSSFLPPFHTLLGQKTEKTVGFQYKYFKHCTGCSPVALLGQRHLHHRRGSARKPASLCWLCCCSVSTCTR